MTLPVGPVYDRYRAAGFDEWLMRIGPEDGPAILFLPPLLEEMNRTRALLASTMRLLGARGYACWLPDLPGTGESERALEACRWDDWRDAAANLGRRLAEKDRRPPAVASLRGGCLLDGDVDAACYWRFAPAGGASLTRDLVRSSLVAPRERQDGVMALAGYNLNVALFEGLKQARPSPITRLRTLRLASDRAAADGKVEGPALWRRSEPGTSPELAAALAFDIGAWVSQCGG